MKLLHNATIAGDGRRYHGYVVVRGELIEQVASGDPDGQLMAACDETLDLHGDLLLPGVIDEHVHFREPGMTRKADIESESRAAVAGGVTSFMEMPNTKPFTTTLETLEAKLQRAAEVSPANYSFYIGATNDNTELLNSLDYSRVCGVKAFLGSSTGGMLLSDSEAKRRLFGQMADRDVLVAVHSEDEDIIARNAREAVRRWGDDPPLLAHSEVRSEEACVRSTADAIALARECGTRLHVCHISTARELELLAQAADERITGEAVIAHLLFTQADYARLGARVKCNPAVKTTADRQALREAVQSGLITTLATDHAPHQLCDKIGGSLRAASGMPMVQFSLVAALGLFSPEVVAERMCHAPARLYGIEGRGHLRKGYKADIAVVRHVPQGHVITDAEVLSKCGWTPLTGTTVHHQVVMTLVNGQVAYRDGQVAEGVRGQMLRFAR